MGLNWNVALAAAFANDKDARIAELEAENATLKEEGHRRNRAALAIADYLECPELGLLDVLYADAMEACKHCPEHLALLDNFQKWSAHVQKVSRENALKAAIEANLVPNNDLKIALIGEFQFDILDADENGDDCQRRVTVPWTTVKDILAAIKARIDAAIGGNDA